MTIKQLAIAISVTQINRDLNLLYPVFADAIGCGLRECAAAGYPVHIFEAWRAPQRQAYLHEQGRSREGRIVTKQMPWLSWHQYALAVDLAFKDSRGWTWEGPWDKVIPIFKAHGLESLAPYEEAHIQMTGGLGVEAAREVYQKYGLQQVWLQVQKLTIMRRGTLAV
jgi:peptidoglycan LD-endopeptidase CwlK